MLSYLFADARYLIIFLDGGVVSLLIMVLSVRLLSRALNQSSSPAASSPQNSNQPKTVDQLDVDIPL